MNMQWKSSFAAAIVMTGMAAAAGTALAEEVNVYSYRQPFLIEPMFEEFTKETGIAVNVVFAKEGLVERLKQEGANSPADLLLTVDISRLAAIKTTGATQAVSSDVLNSAIPANLRDEDGHWFGLTTRARIIYASKDRVPEGTVTSYDDLTKPEWKGKVCTRSGSHVYNIALLASKIAHDGADQAKAWLAGVKENLARKPEGNDRAQVKAIKEGECDLALGNHYYMGAMLSNPEQKEWAESAYIIVPDQGGRGTHVNVSGIALTKAAPNKANAIKLMEFLAGEKAQEMYADLNNEYPVRPGVEWSPLLKSWGDFKTDELSLSAIAELAPKAQKLVDEVGYDE